MARITVEDCIDKFESRFELVLVASNRARKLHSGESPTVEKDNDKNTVIALREIADETISITEMKENLVQEYQTLSYQNDEDLSLDYADSTEETQDSKVDIDNNDQDIITEADNDVNEENYHEDEPNDNSKENPEESAN